MKLFKIKFDAKQFLLFYDFAIYNTSWMLFHASANKYGYVVVEIAVHSEFIEKFNEYFNQDYVKNNN